MVRRYGVIQDTKAETLLGFIQPSPPSVAVSGEFQQELLLVASMCNMPNHTWYIISISPRHAYLVLSHFAWKTVFHP